MSTLGKRTKLKVHEDPRFGPRIRTRSSQFSDATNPRGLSQNLYSCYRFHPAFMVASDACRLSNADLSRDVSLLFALTLSGSWLHRANRHLARFWKPCKLEACSALSWAYTCMPTWAALSSPNAPSPNPDCMGWVTRARVLDYLSPNYRAHMHSTSTIVGTASPLQS